MGSKSSLDIAMESKDLLDALLTLKRNLDSIINKVQQMPDSVCINRVTNKHVSECKTHLSSICDIIESTKIEDSDSQPHLQKNIEHQIGIDDLDDLDFDEFVLDTPLSAGKNHKSQEIDLKKEENGNESDSTEPIDLDDEDEMRIQEEMAQELTEENADRPTICETFDDFNLDAEDLGMIEEAEKSALGEAAQLLEDEPDDIHQPEDPSYQEVLKQYFGYSKFRPFQWKIINSVLNDKRDNCVIMATGYGKSLTFQFPSVYTKRVSVIISPLISLMQDQVHNLKASNIEACFLGSAQDNMRQIKDDMFRGKYRIVYVTPEYASTAIDQFKRLDQNIGIDLIAIDEAHCVSQWGHDFRASYRQLGILKKTFPKVPVLAVTATATVNVRSDICRSLQLINPNMTCTGFDRPNLFLSVSPKTGDIANDLRMEMKRVGNKFSFEGPTIIYCPTKRATEDVINALNGLDISCLPYHASLSLAARKKAHNSFLNDQIQVVVATVAFGMGIDKPDVRKVIHYGAPKDIESYYQEIGRAGRDGMPSECVAIFSRNDFSTSRHFISEISSERFRDHKLKMLAKLEQYLSTTSCRRRILLSYFESGNLEEIGGTENCCDCCRLNMSKLKHGLTSSNDETGSFDYSREAQDLFKVIQFTGGRFGLGVPCQILTGSYSQKIKQFQSSKAFGSGKYKSLKFWNALGRSLLYEGYLREKSLQSGYGCTVEMTPKAESWYNKVKQGKSQNCPLIITPSGDLLQVEQAQRAKAVTIAIKPQPRVVSERPSLTQFAASPTKNSKTSLVSQPAPAAPPVDEKTAKLQTELYGKLVKARNDLAQETGFTPHNIASNRVLLDMARFRPGSKTSLLKIEDFSEVKVERFGNTFVKLVSSFCEQNSLKVDEFPTLNSDIYGNKNDDLKADLMKITETQRQSYMMFALQGKPVEEVASQRGLKTASVISHLSEALKEGLSVDIRRLGVTPHIEGLITEAVWAPPVNGVTSSLTKIKDQLPTYIEYNQIKLVVSLLSAKHGLETNSDGDLKLRGSPVLASNITAMSVTDVDVLNDPETAVKCDSTSTPTSKKRSYDQSFSDESPSPSLRKVLTSPYNRSDSFTSIANQSSGPTSKPKSDEQTLSHSNSFDSNSQSVNIFSQSQSQSQSQSNARKLPAWMASTGNKSVFKKKMKSNSLFK